MGESIRTSDRKVKNVFRSFFSVEFLFLAGYILSPYTLYGFSLSIYIWLLCFTYVVIKHKTKCLTIDKHFLFMIGFIAIHEFFILFSHGNNVVLNNLINALILAVFVIIFGKYFKYDKFLNVYYMVGIIVSILLMIQVIQIYVLHQYAYPIKLIPGLIDMSTNQWSRQSMRPMSCFVEPQAFATFILPIIFFLIKYKKYFRASIFTCAVLLSGSSLGILMCVLLWGTEVFNSSLSFRKRLIIMILMIIATIVFFQSSIFITAVDKIKNIDVQDNARISQGFKIYNQMPTEDKIIGIGKVPLDQYMINENISVDRMKRTDSVGKWTYVTTISGIMISYGIIGLLVFLNFIRAHYKKGNFEIREFLIIVLCLSFGQTIFFNIPFGLYYTFLFIIEKDMKKQTRVVNCRRQVINKNNSR